MAEKIDKAKKSNKKIRKFNNEDEESDFWQVNSPLDFPQNFEQVNLNLSNLSPSTQSMTIRVPEGLIIDLKTVANKMGVPYQSLVKMWLSNKVKEELKRA